jgi:hypothetical protein
MQGLQQHQQHQQGPPKNAKGESKWPWPGSQQKNTAPVLTPSVGAAIPLAGASPKHDPFKSDAPWLDESPHDWSPSPAERNLSIDLMSEAPSDSGVPFAIPESQRTAAGMSILREGAPTPLEQALPPPLPREEGSGPPGLPFEGGADLPVDAAERRLFKHIDTCFGWLRQELVNCIGVTQTAHSSAAVGSHGGAVVAVESGPAREHTFDPVALPVGGSSYRRGSSGDQLGGPFKEHSMGDIEAMWVWLEERLEELHDRLEKNPGAPAIAAASGLSEESIASRLAGEYASSHKKHHADVLAQIEGLKASVEEQLKASTDKISESLASSAKTMPPPMQPIAEEKHLEKSQPLQDSFQSRMPAKIIGRPTQNASFRKPSKDSMVKSADLQNRLDTGAGVNSPRDSDVPTTSVTKTNSKKSLLYKDVAQDTAEKHTAITFDVSVIEQDNGFDSTTQQTFCKMLAKNIICDRVDVVRLKKGKEWRQLVVSLHAIGFVSEVQADQAISLIKANKAVDDSVWGKNWVVGSPKTTTLLHVPSPWLRQKMNSEKQNKFGFEENTKESAILLHNRFCCESAEKASDMRSYPHVDAWSVTHETHLDTMDNHAPPSTHHKGAHPFHRHVAKIFGCVPKFNEWSHRDWLHLLSSVIVVLNTSFIAVCEQAKSKHSMHGVALPGWLLIGEICFVVIFIFELMVRVWIRRGAFFHDPDDMYWNYMDVILIFTSCAELAMKQIFDLSCLRALRLFRSLRIFRVIRQLQTLRLIVAMIGSAIFSVFWALVFLAVCTFMASVFFLQVIGAHYESGLASDSFKEEAETYYDGIFITMLSLFASISGGYDWMSVARPLQDIHSGCVLLYLGFVFFVVFGLMNVLTGIFVDNTKAAAQQDNEVCLQMQMKNKEAYSNQITAVLKEADTDNSGNLSYEELDTQLKCDHFVAKLEMLEMTPDESKAIFKLLDEKGTGEVAISSFMAGLMRYKGTASHVDIATLIYESKKSAKKWDAYVDYVEAQFALLREALHTHRQALANIKETVTNPPLPPPKDDEDTDDEHDTAPLLKKSDDKSPRS